MEWGNFINDVFIGMLLGYVAVTVFIVHRAVRRVERGLDYIFKMQVLTSAHGTKVEGAMSGSHVL